MCDPGIVALRIRRQTILVQWTFFVISTECLNEKIGEQKSIRLNVLRRIGAEEVDYNSLAASIDRAAGA